MTDTGLKYYLRNKMLYTIRKNGKYGFIDESGNMIIKPEFDIVLNFQYGCCVVLYNGKHGLISEKGNFILKPEFSALRIVGENRLAVKDKKFYALMNFQGDLLTEHVYGGIFDCSEERFLAYKGIKWGYLNFNGKEEIPFDFEFGESYQHGYAMVKRGRKYGLINQKGIFEREPEYDFYYAYEDCYVVNVGGNLYDDDMDGGKFGVLSLDNIPRTGLEYDYIGRFNEGEAIVKKDNLFGRIDLNGNIIIPIEHKEPVLPVEPVHCIVRNNQYGLVDHVGKELIPPVYEYLIAYPKSKLCWAKQNGLYGILNFENKFLIPPTFDLRTIYPIHEEYVHVDLKNDKNGLLSTISGKWILPPEYDSIGIFEGTLVELRKDGKLCYANHEGEIVWME